MIEFNCPNCGAEIEVPDEVVGTNGKCGDCGVISRVPRKSTGNISAQPSSQSPQKNASTPGAYLKQKVPLLIATIILGTAAILVLRSAVSSANREADESRERSAQLTQKRLEAIGAANQSTKDVSPPVSRIHKKEKHFVQLVSDQVQIHFGPSATSQVVAIGRKGDIFQLNTTENGWRKIYLFSGESRYFEESAAIEGEFQADLPKTLSRRQEIFRALIKAEQQAESEARRRFPINNFKSAFDEKTSLIQNNIEYQRILNDKFKLEVMHQFEVQPPIYGPLTIEGAKDRWEWQVDEKINSEKTVIIPNNGLTAQENVTTIPNNGPKIPVKLTTEQKVQQQIDEAKKRLWGELASDEEKGPEDFPKLAGKWSNGAEGNDRQTITITQTGKDFTATCLYRHPVHKGIQWKLTGSLTNDGRIFRVTGRLVHTQAPKDFLSQTVIAVVSKDGDTITGRAVIDNTTGYNFVWRITKRADDGM